ncbi:MAG TPA: DUF2269 family protein [Actinomycetota bacterium]|nr:DUF2269 family protein [Actinomycetota bacterium]
MLRRRPARSAPPAAMGEEGSGMVAALYEWLKAGHILMAIVWVGGAVALQVLATRTMRAQDPERLRIFAGEVEFVGTRIFTPASLLLLLFGIWMVIDSPAWEFTQFWVIAALAMFAFSFVSGAFYLGPQSGKLKRLYEAEGANAAGARELIGKLFLVSRIELVLMVLIVLDMVIKPGI